MVALEDAGRLSRFLRAAGALHLGRNDEREMTTLKLAEFDGSGILAIALSDILHVLRGQGEAIQWSLLWFQATGNHDVAVPEAVVSTRTGKVLSWKDLLALANRVEGIEDVVLVGTEPGSALATLQDVESGHYNAEVLIECVDSSYWLVSSANDIIIKNFRDRFAYAQEA